MNWFFTLFSETYRVLRVLDAATDCTWHVDVVTNSHYVCLHGHRLDVYPVRSFFYKRPGWTDALKRAHLNTVTVNR